MTEDQTISIASSIVAAYVSHNAVTVEALPGLIASTHQSLANLGKPAPEPIAEAPKEPAVPIKKSVTQDYIICLEDGRKFKSLKRHIGTHYGLSPVEYRAKWGLPADYPMVAPAYAKTRSDLAKKIGLGVQRPKLAAVS